MDQDQVRADHAAVGSKYRTAAGAVVEVVGVLETDPAKVEIKNAKGRTFQVPASYSLIPVDGDLAADALPMSVIEMVRAGGSPLRAEIERELPSMSNAEIEELAKLDGRMFVQDLVIKARAARVVPPGPDALCPICMSRVDLEESPIPGVEHLVLSPHRHDSAMCLGTGKTVMHAAQVASRKVQAKPSTEELVAKVARGLLDEVEPFLVHDSPAVVAAARGRIALLEQVAVHVHQLFAGETDARTELTAIRRDLPEDDPLHGVIEEAFQAHPPPAAVRHAAERAAVEVVTPPEVEIDPLVEAFPELTQAQRDKILTMTGQLRDARKAISRCQDAEVIRAAILYGEQNGAGKTVLNLLRAKRERLEDAGDAAAIGARPVSKEPERQEVESPEPEVIAEVSHPVPALRQPIALEHVRVVAVPGQAHDLYHAPPGLKPSRLGSADDPELAPLVRALAEHARKASGSMASIGQAFEALHNAVQTLRAHGIDASYKIRGVRVIDNPHD